MALNLEQQQNVDAQIAIQTAQHANQMIWQSKQAKLEVVRLAQQTLLENARSKPVDSRDVAAADITAFATTLVAYIDA